MTSPHPRLFLVTPPDADTGLVLAAARAAVAAGDVASLLIAAGSGQKAAAKGLTKAMQALNLAVLIENDWQLALSCKADGVLVAASAFAIARSSAGDGAIVGARCNSRHEAMSAAEAGADFVAFSGLGLIEWWSGLFEIPCVSLIASATAVKGADFLRPPDSMWESAASASAVAGSLMREIKENAA